MNTDPSIQPHRPPSWPIGLAYRAWKMWVARAAVLALFGLAAFLLGSCYRGTRDRHREAKPTDAGAPAAAPQSWTCSMHPQIKLTQPGQCPICFMDLIPVTPGQYDDDAPTLTLNARARTLARVTTAPVERREVAHELHMVGKVAPDETHIVYVSSYIPGRLDRLFVDYTGIFVRKGDHLAEIYSPELLVAQREYLVALEGVERAEHAPADSLVRQSARTLLEGARRKLELWGVPPDELQRLQRERQPSDQIRIDAPDGGWVLERQAFEGMYVETGTRLFTLVDLRTVWVLLEAYELDLPFLRLGQRVEFETEAYPGRKFEGRVAYIDPRLTEVTRTIKVRVNAINTGGELRPGMFVRAAVRAQVGEGGQIIEPSLMGKWVCPMHPEIVKDGPGACDQCGMDIVSAESLGYAPARTPGRKVLVIPQTAALLTGQRAIVYVEAITDAGEVTYTGREVELGLRAGNWYVVTSGLQEGERVAVQGAFQIDSALQIQARPSMMQPASGASTTPEPPPDIVHRAVNGAGYHQLMRPAIAAYLDLAEALAADNAKEAVAAVKRLGAALAQAAPLGLEGEGAEAFSQQVAALQAALPAESTSDPVTLRTQLPAMTAAWDVYLRTFGHDRDQPLVLLHCPMAFANRGADWFQPDAKVRNPYFGKKMYRCGEKRAAIGADGKEVRP